MGLSNHHCLGDARSIVGFIKGWAEINKSGDEEAFVSKNVESLLIFERSVMGDCSRLDGIFWNVMKNIPLEPPRPHPLPTNRVRASFILTQSDIRKLKNLLSVQVSSFVVTAAYVWTTLVRSDNAHDDENEVFVLPADGRGRPSALFDPPVPVNYFGNCLGGGVMSVEHRKLAAEDGFVVAAEAIDDEIKTKIYDRNEFLKNPEYWLREMPNFKDLRMLVASGSPKFDLSEADFGWGEARKVEVLSLDSMKYSMSLCNSDNGLVVGMSLPRKIMESFEALFEDGLRMN